MKCGVQQAPRRLTLRADSMLPLEAGINKL